MTPREAVVCAAMPWHRPLTVKEVQAVADLYGCGWTYPQVKALLESLVARGMLRRMVRKPHTGRPAACYVRVVRTGLRVVRW